MQGGLIEHFNKKLGCFCEDILFRQDLEEFF